MVADGPLPFSAEACLAWLLASSAALFRPISKAWAIASVTSAPWFKARANLFEITAAFSALRFNSVIWSAKAAKTDSSFFTAACNLLKSTPLNPNAPPPPEPLGPPLANLLNPTLPPLLKPWTPCLFILSRLARPILSAAFLLNTNSPGVSNAGTVSLSEIPPPLFRPLLFLTVSAKPWPAAPLAAASLAFFASASVRALSLPAFPG